MRMPLRNSRFAGLVVFVLLTASTAWAGDGGAGEASMTHRMMMLVMQLGTILFAARLGGMLMEHIKMPSVLGELLAGVLIGPYLMGGIPLIGLPDGLFHAGNAFPVTPELYGICTVAAVLLLFMVGLETDIKLFVRYSVVGGMVGIGGVAVSFVLGDLMAILFGRMLYNQPLHFLSPSCLLLGIISTATSVGITARILGDERKLQSPEGVTILAGAVIDDILGIVLLAIGLGVITASKATGLIDWGNIGMIALKAVVVWLAATAIGLAASRRISVLLKWFRDRSAIAVMALGLALVLAGLFEKAGLAMIIGAYVMGLSLARSDINQVIREQLHPIHAFLVPVFFTVMGMLVDLSLLLSVDVLLFGVLYTIAANLAKIFGCGIPALFFNFNLRGALRIGVGMLPRGEVTLIIAGIGLSAGVLSPEIFGVVVLMIVLTALMAPVSLVRLFRHPGSGLRKPVAEEETQPIAFHFPSPQTAELLVGKLMNTFESEGFFVHTLDRARRVYQLRKDDVVIGFQHRGTDIVFFDCGRDVISFVHTAMYEVLAELERTVRELRKPVDRAVIGRAFQPHVATQEQRAALADYLDQALLRPQLKGTSKEEVIDELLECLRSSGVIHDFDAARRAVLAREESMSTGIQFGIAIPHGRTDAVGRLVVAIGLKPEGIDFEAIDGHPSRIFVLTLSPQTAPAPQMQFMSMINEVLTATGRGALLACQTPEEMYAVLTGEPPRKSRRTPGGSLLGLMRRRLPKVFSLSRYVKPDCLIPELKGTTREQVIDELLSLLESKGLLAKKAEVCAALLQREKELPTGVGHGVAIPHVRSDDVDDLVCAIGVQRDGIDFAAPDGKTAQIIVLTLSPCDKPTPHGQFMAMISRALVEERDRERVLAAHNPEEMWQALIATNGYRRRKGS
jgi:Kef-type K+ transport system membrane component KefB/mannitol/fructose-specific phosphotransferase system IIA component (Ntr-type)